MVAAALASREECYCRGRLPDPFLFLPFLNSRKPAPTSPSPQWPPQDSTNSPPPPHVVPVNFPTTTSIPLRSSAHTASPHSVQYRRFCSGGRFAPPRVQPCPCCAWSSPRLDLPFFRDLPRQRSTLVRANADFTCIPESGDVPLYDDDTLVQTVFVPPASNHAYAISSYTSTYVRRVLRFECSVFNALHFRKEKVMCSSYKTCIAWMIQSHRSAQCCIP